jgi:putative chitinase
LDNSKIPGTNEAIPLQRGQPNTILKAFMADLNWYVESLNNGWGSVDEGGWTPTNSVPTSNHLGGTAFDYNWNDHPMGPQVPDEAAGWQGSDITNNQPEEPRVRELLKYYEDTVFWGNDWDQPHDSMHFQMGYNTYSNPHTQDFINRKIDADTGLSRFKQTRQGQPPAAPDKTGVLAQAMRATQGVDYSQYVDSVGQCLAECECNTVLRIAMWMAQVGTESAGLKYMEEIADGSQYEGRTDIGNTQPGDGQRFKGRGPIQITGRGNYTALSAWAADQNLVPSPTFFVDNPTQLASAQYGFMGVTWYWTTQRPMNDAADAGDVKLATQYVNGGYHGLPDRQDRYTKNIAIGDTLLSLVGTAGAPTPPPPSVLPGAGVDTARLNAAVDKILCGGTMPPLWPSRSFLAGADAARVDDTIGILLNTDGNAWNLMLTIGYLSDVPLAIAQVEAVANGQFPDGSYVATNPWLKQFGQEFCIRLINFKGRMNAVFSDAESRAPQPPINPTPPVKG